MTTQIFVEFKRAVAEKEIDVAADDFRLALLSTNTDADTENNAISFVDDLTLDEFDGANYERKVLSGVAISKDGGVLRIDWDDVTFTALGAGTRSIAGALILLHVTDDTDSIPVAFIEKSGTPDGNDFLVQWHATDKVLYF